MGDNFTSTTTSKQPHSQDARRRLWKQGYLELKARANRRRRREKGYKAAGPEDELLHMSLKLDKILLQNQMDSMKDQLAQAHREMSSTKIRLEKDFEDAQQEVERLIEDMRQRTKEVDISEDASVTSMGELSAEENIPPPPKPLTIDPNMDNRIVLSTSLIAGQRWIPRKASPRSSSAIVPTTSLIAGQCSPTNKKVAERFDKRRLRRVLTSRRRPVRQSLAPFASTFPKPSDNH